MSELEIFICEADLVMRRGDVDRIPPFLLPGELILGDDSILLRYSPLSLRDAVCTHNGISYRRVVCALMRKIKRAATGEVYIVPGSSAAIIHTPLLSGGKRYNIQVKKEDSDE